MFSTTSCNNILLIMNSVRRFSARSVPVLAGFSNTNHAFLSNNAKHLRPQLRNSRKLPISTAAETSGETYPGVYGPWKIEKEDLIEAS